MNVRSLEDNLYCSITGQIFSNPVITPCGQTYEKEALLKCENCPNCREPIVVDQLIPNISMKQIVESYLITNPTQRENQYFTPESLCELVKAGTVEQVITLLKLHPECLNTPLVDHQPLLHFIVKNGKLLLLQAIAKEFPTMDWNIQVNYPEHAIDGCTALHFAARETEGGTENCEAMLAFLLTQGADPSITSLNGATPLIAATACNFKGKMRILLQDKRTHNTVNVFTLSQETALIKAVDAEATQILLSSPQIRPNFRPNGCSAIFVAASEGNLEKVRVLAKVELIDIECVLDDDQSEISTISIASSKGHKEVVEFLNTVPVVANIIKFYLSETYFADAIRVIMHYENNEHEKDHNNDTPNVVAVLDLLTKESNYKEFCEFLLWEFVDGYIAGRKNKLIITLLNGSPSTVNALLSNGQTIPHKAVCSNNLSLLEELSTIPGIDWDLHTGFVNEGCVGFTALHYAIRFGYEDIINFLLSQGAAPTVSTAINITPLMFAVEYFPRCVKRLLEDSAVRSTVNDAIDKVGLTALHISMLKTSKTPDDLEAEERLFSITTLNPNVVDSRGFTPLYIAVFNNNVNAVVSLLRIPGINVQNAFDYFQLAQNKKFSSISALLYSASLIQNLLQGYFPQPILVEYPNQVHWSLLERMVDAIANNGFPEEVIAKVKFTLKRIKAHHLNEAKDLKDLAQEVPFDLADPDKSMVTYNKLFEVAHRSNDPHKNSWQKGIRETAFGLFKQAIVALPPSEKISRLEWGKKQLLFSIHTRESTKGPTNTVKEMDKMIEQERKIVRRTH